MFEDKKYSEEANQAAVKAGGIADLDNTTQKGDQVVENRGAGK